MIIFVLPFVPFIWEFTGPWEEEWEGARGGVAFWKESYPGAQRSKAETLAVRAFSPAERSISVGFPQAWHILSVRVISTGETCTSYNDGAAFAICNNAVNKFSSFRGSADRRWMAVGDDRVCELQELQSSCWGVSTANPGVSEESTKKGVRRWREEVSVAGAAVYKARRPSYFGGLWRAE